jgi:hypothetical protein
MLGSINQVLSIVKLWPGRLTLAAGQRIFGLYYYISSKREKLERNAAGTSWPGGDGAIFFR